MKHLEESNKEAKEDAEMDAEIELEMSRGACTPVRTPDDGGAHRGSQEGSKPGSPLLVKHQGLVKKTTVSSRCGRKESRQGLDPRGPQARHKSYCDPLLPPECSVAGLGREGGRLSTIPCGRKKKLGSNVFERSRNSTIPLSQSTSRVSAGIVFYIYKTKPDNMVQLTHQKFKILTQHYPILFQG